MAPRIFLLHAYRFSMGPIEEAFRRDWPEAEAVRLLDESLYADVAADGAMPADIGVRLTSLFRHCQLSGAKAMVFTGSTFGPAVEEARAGFAMPILKADEAMAEAAVAKGRRILILATAQRALPVLRRSIEAAAVTAGVDREISTAWVEGAKAANDGGRIDEHDRLVARAAEDADGFDVVVLGQMSMAPAVGRMSAAAAAKAVTSPCAAVARLKRLLAV
ncbi:MAG: aspartate/glutamate racemase family protein [Hyphomicrobiaceae bacterium]